MTLPVLFTAGTGAYNIQRSLRFRSSASAYLNRTLGSSGSLRAWTWSAWVKRGTLGVQQDLFGWVDLSGGNFQQVIGFNSDNTLEFQMYNSALGGYVNRKTTTQVFRDPSAWYHIVVTWDSNNATADDRARIYINGTRVTAWANNTNPSLNQDSYINNSSYPLGIGRCMPSSSNYFDGYLTEVNFVNAQALTPSSFGQTNSATGVWQPIKYSGTYGTNGFYLNFSDNSNNTATTIGKDYSGNGNNWTPNNISVTSGATYDSMTDVPTLTSPTAANYCVMNPLYMSGTATPTNGNLTVSQANNFSQVAGTFGMSSGKWYYEHTVTAVGGEMSVGIGSAPATGIIGVTSTQYGYYSVNGRKFTNGVDSLYGAAFTTGDVIGVAYDADAGSLTFYKNGTTQGTAFTGITGTMFPLAATRTTGGQNTSDFNFGQRPFAYTPPTGFVALNTFNLPIPTIGATASSQANRYMDVLTWTGNGASSRAITGLNFQPDWVWDKMRSGAYQHAIVDSVRGGNQVLHSNSTSAEDTNWQYGYVSSFNSNGFTIQSGATSSENWNLNGSTFVAWNWKANGSGSTNTAGSITSTVSANTTAGFSIVTYTGTGANATVGHGLGVAPSMIIARGRSAGTAGFNWRVYHGSLAATAYLEINLTSAQQTDATVWNSTAPTSSVFSLGSSGNVNGSTQTYVAYCFAQIAGYSAFGSYTGNGSADGTFVFTGFRPRYLLLKLTNTTGSWQVKDSARNTYNVTDLTLYPNLSNAEASDIQVDFLSNGFKLRSSTGENANGNTVIYAAFAENPFKYSLAR